MSYYGARYYDKVSLLWTQGDPKYRFAPDAAWTQPRRANLYTANLTTHMRYMDPDGRDVSTATDGADGQGPTMAGPDADDPLIDGRQLMSDRDWREVDVLQGRAVCTRMCVRLPELTEPTSSRAEGHAVKG